MNHIFETSLKFPNNVVITKTVAVPEQETDKDVKLLHIKITNNFDVKIPLTLIRAEKFGNIDIKFYGIPIEVRQKGKVLLYGIFKGDYLNDCLAKQTRSEVIGIPQYKYFQCRFKSNMDTYISPIFLGAPVTLSDSNGIN